MDGTVAAIPSTLSACLNHPTGSSSGAPFLDPTEGTKDRAEGRFPQWNQRPTNPSHSARNLVLGPQGREGSASRFNSCFPEENYTKWALSKWQPLLL